MAFLSKNRELLAQYRVGDPEALTKVYFNYAPMVTAFLRKGTTERAGGRPYFLPGVDNLADLEDILQETFVRAFSETARRSYDGSVEFRNYLFAIAKNVQLDRLRKRGIDLTQEPLDPTGLEDPNPKPASLTVLEKELRSLVLSFCEQLSGYQKEVFRTHFIDGLSLRKTAHKTSRTLMVVRYQVVKLKRKLRSYLKKNGYL